MLKTKEEIRKAKKGNEDECTFCNGIFFEGDKQIIYKKMVFCSEECIKNYEEVFGE